MQFGEFLFTTDSGSTGAPACRKIRPDPAVLGTGMPDPRICRICRIWEIFCLGITLSTVSFPLCQIVRFAVRAAGWLASSSRRRLALGTLSHRPLIATPASSSPHRPPHSQSVCLSEPFASLVPLLVGVLRASFSYNNTGNFQIRQIWRIRLRFRQFCESGISGRN